MQYLTRIAPGKIFGGMTMVVRMTIIIVIIIIKHVEEEG